MGASRRALLTVALGFCAIDWRGPTPAAAAALYSCMDSWRCLGLVVDGLGRHGFRLVYLSTLNDDVWRTTFGTNELFAPEGFGSGPTPWRAVEAAATIALKDPGIVA